MEQEKKEAQVQVDTLEARLKEWGIDLERFRAKADETKGKAKAEREREVAALRAKLNEAQKKLEELKKTGDAASGDLKKGVENAWAELKKAFESATAKFK
jgi:predicted RNase H-like nuclease (RuvC/YqgF family)